MGTLKTLKVSEYRIIDAFLDGSDSHPSKLGRIKHMHLITHIDARNRPHIGIYIYATKSIWLLQICKKILYALSAHTVSFPNFTLQLVALSGLHLEKGMCSKEIENRLLFPS